MSAEGRSFSLPRVAACQQTLAIAEFARRRQAQFEEELAGELMETGLATGARIDVAANLVPSCPCGERGRQSRHRKFAAERGSQRLVLVRPSRRGQHVEPGVQHEQGNGDHGRAVVNDGRSGRLHPA